MQFISNQTKLTKKIVAKKKRKRKQNFPNENVKVLLFVQRVFFGARCLFYIYDCIPGRKVKQYSDFFQHHVAPQQIFLLVRDDRYLQHSAVLHRSQPRTLEKFSVATRNIIEKQFNQLVSEICIFQLFFSRILIGLRFFSLFVAKYYFYVRRKGEMR